MRAHRALPFEVVACVWRHRAITKALVRREVLGRYRGSMLGLAWSFLHPVVMLGIYTFVFGVVFKARWRQEGGSWAEFALALFAGLLVYGLFAECVARAPVLVTGNPNYVKKVVFPLEILPWVAIGSAMFHCLVSLGVWLLFHLCLFGLPHAATLLLPFIVLPLMLVTLGCTWAFASLGVYLRDMAQIAGLLTTALTFLSPIFYPLSAVPPVFRSLMLLNPLTSTIEMARGALLWNSMPDWILLATSYVVGGLVAWAGFAWFQKTRSGFADVV